MQPEWMDFFLIAAVVALANLLDWQRRREGSRLSRRSAAIAKETENEVREAVNAHERALKKALKEIP